MSQLQELVCNVLDSEKDVLGVVTLTPSSVRNGLVTMRGKEDNTLNLPAGGLVTATYSVRQGRPSDPNNGAKRIKRKVIAKVRVPVTVPGVVSGDVIDYVDIDLTVAAPVEADPGSIYTGLNFMSLDGGAMNQWVEDMILNGNEPY
jgi:hypothetical protein